MKHVEKKNIGIYGGSFNPIHLGHTVLGKELCKQGYVDELWYVVSPQNPLKHASELLDDKERLHLCHLAVKHTPLLSVSDIEFHLPRPNYMVDTLTWLRGKYPDVDFTLVIGSDNWLNFHRWYKPQEILQHHHVIIFPRKEYEIDITNLPQGVSLANTPIIELSSTEIREAIRSKSYDGRGLPEAVWQEIQNKHHYL